MLLVIYTDNLLSSSNNTRFCDCGLLGFNEIGLNPFSVCHAFNFFSEKVMTNSPAQRRLSTKTCYIVGNVRGPTQTGFLCYDVYYRNRSFRGNPFYFSEIVFVKHHVPDDQYFAAIKV